MNKTNPSTLTDAVKQALDKKHEAARPDMKKKKPKSSKTTVFR